MSKFTVEVTVPEGLKAGDVFQVEIDTPTADKKPRGMLAGLTLDQMTDEQIKRELINANSVLYKAVQRGASAETIAANTARVEAVKAEKIKRTPAPSAIVTPNITGAVEGPIDANTATEI